MTEIKSSNKTLVVITHALVWVAIAIFAVLPFRGQHNGTQDAYPRKPIEIVVPFKAGGGSDLLVRMFQKTITEKKLLPVPLVVVNRPGASATDGSRHVKDAAADGYTMLNLHDAIIISKHFKKVDYGPEAFEAIAGTVTSVPLIVVKENSPYKNFADLVSAAKENPSQIIFGCAMGTPTHVSGLLIEKEAGIKFNLIQSGGGAARLEQLMGDHIDVSVFSVSEYINFKSQGLRALVYMGQERHPDLPEIKTAKEYGFNALIDVMQYWWFPKGTDPKIVNKMADVFRQALEDEELLSFIKSMKTSPDFASGEQLQERLQTVEKRIASLEAQQAHELPPFHLIVGGAVLLFFLYILWDNAKKSTQNPIAKDPLNLKPAVITILILCLYIFLMSTGVVDFRILTFAFMIILGLILSAKQTISKTILIECALMISLGTYYVFTNIVHVDLP